MNTWEKINNDIYRHDNYCRMGLVREFVRARVDGRILDIGCGDGSMWEGSKNIYGVDVCAEQLAIAKCRGLHVDYCNTDEMMLPYGDRMFDSVVCSEVLEHVLLPDNIIREAYRVLANDGRFIVTVPNLASIGRRIMLAIGHNPYIEISPLDRPASGHIRYFVIQELRRLLKKYGFKIVDYKGDAINLAHHHGAECKWLAKIFPSFARIIMVVAVKA
jgi:methionine biosynthesis protein MetW